MKVLKKKFKKLLIKKKAPSLLKIPQKPIKLKIKPKLGRWCEYYEGRLPYPMECSSNKSMPLSQIFKGKEVTTIRHTPNCVDCERAPQFHAWKKGDWAKIIEAIKRGEDLTDMDPPRQGMR
ncbi:MAG: hypothetical protein GY797_38805 [Deltaproteobacteria bacterium]|nr:hypothetical protein [Deltaproteobacteria bacterium]